MGFAFKTLGFRVHCFRVRLWALGFWILGFGGDLGLTLDVSSLWTLPTVII